MKILDRYILRGLLVNYGIAMAVMISLYVLLDLFFNMDEFTESGAGAADLAADVASFYGYRIFLYFSQLSGIIALFACLVTLARMRRLNELVAVLSSGVSLYRVAAPVVAFAIVTTGLWFVDVEYAIPRIANKLARAHDDARGTRTFDVYFLEDRDLALVSARQYVPTEQVLKRLLVLKRAADGSFASFIEAERATWEPAADGAPGRWKLERGMQRKREVTASEGLAPRGDIAADLVPYYESDLDPKSIEMRQAATWIKYLNTRQLNELAGRSEGQSLQQIKQARSMRVATPLVNLVMLLLGLPFILDRRSGNLLVDGGKALAVCGACFLLTFVVQNMGAEGPLALLPAWAPVLIFAPVAAVLLDRMRT
jgi:lipopolysaccharide export system permease protein